MKYSEHLKEMESIYREKKEKYGDNFGKQFNEYGGIVGIIRIGDKFERLKNILLYNLSDTPDERIKDTFLDLANYAIMTLIEIEKNDKRDNKETNRT